MKINFFRKALPKFAGIIMLLIISISNTYAEVSEANAEEIVKNSPCIEGKTIEEALKDKIKVRSQRDLGWQVFNENGQFEAERAFLMNKSMQLRFRWRVNQDGSITPISERAISLCANTNAQLDATTAENLVKNASCLDGNSIDETLKKKSNCAHSVT